MRDCCGSAAAQGVHAKVEWLRWTGGGDCAAARGSSGQTTRSGLRSREDGTSRLTRNHLKKREAHRQSTIDADTQSTTTLESGGGLGEGQTAGCGRGGAINKTVCRSGSPGGGEGGRE